MREYDRSSRANAHGRPSTRKPRARNSLPSAVCRLPSASTRHPQGHCHLSSNIGQFAAPQFESGELGRDLYP
eukprot:4008816-Prymnesium_polylepis.2